MAQDDPFVRTIVGKVVLQLETDASAIGWRQGVLKDCLAHPDVVRDLYALTIQAIDLDKHYYLSIFTRYAAAVLDRSLEVLRGFMTILLKLRTIAESQDRHFESDGFRGLFSVVSTELNSSYFGVLGNMLDELRFPKGILMSGRLGEGFKGTDYVLRRPPDHGKSWFQKVVNTFQAKPESYAFTLHERDENGAKALSELRERGLNLVANSLGQATDHILSFFQLLRTELAFYVGALNLADKLKAKGVALCLPTVEEAGTRRHSFSGLTDSCLGLVKDTVVVGSALGAHGKDLIVITGANQGGKTTFLRAVGLAQVMAQCGLYVTARTATIELCRGLFTHFRRREDSGMKSGKLDEELSRMSAIVDHLEAGSLVLFNESFAATNEREGSEIAWQIVTSLVERRIKILFVTHQFELARRLFERGSPATLFLQVTQQPDGHCNYQLTEGDPAPTSHGVDLWDQIFAHDSRAGDAI